MCGRIGFDIRPGQLAERFPWLRIPEDLPPRYNVAPTQPLFVIDEQNREASLLRWGIDGRSRTGHFNLREETVAENPRYRNLPAVIIRLLDSLAHIVEYTGDASQRKALLRQAEMVMRGAELDIDEPHDLSDIQRRYDAVVVTARRMEGSGPAAGANGWD